MYELIVVICVLALLALVIGSMLSFIDHPHWFVRGWEFPRVQIIGLSIALALVVTAVAMFTEARSTSSALTFVWALVALLTIWHGVRVISYTRFGFKQSLPTKKVESDRGIRVVFSNVEQGNDQHESWIKEIEQADADVVVGLEFDSQWMDATADFREKFPYRVEQPQDNYYGMVMLSRLPIQEAQIRFVVQDDIPSIDAKLELPSGEQVRLISVHPRPPEPVRDQDSVPRDAELITYGKELRDETMPVIVGGDLNDVAWSKTTRLFLKISKLLDPRRGRGFYNTFHARYRLLRVPLDHVFHSEHFSLRAISRLGYIGSDHFPIMLQLQLEERPEQRDLGLAASESDHQQADRLIERESDPAAESHSVQAAD